MDNSVKKNLKNLANIIAGSETIGMPAAAGIGAEDNILLSWNNFYGSWVDGGWNNFYGSWSDAGWNNFYGSWSDAGWNNFYGSWSDAGWNNFYGSWGDGGSGGGGGCFLTTACVDHKGLADDCYELQVLRTIRDTIITWNDEMKSLVEEYYRIAPFIVERINASDNRDAVWDDMYDNLIMKCIEYYENNNIKKAVELYIDTVKSLRETYGVE